MDRLPIMLFTCLLKMEAESPEGLAACESKTFEEFLRKQKLTENLIHFVVFAIAMVRPDCTAEEGLRQTRYFQYYKCSPWQVFQKIYLVC